MLLKLLEQSRENRTLAVAASDLGHFISAHPHGRNIVTGQLPTGILHLTYQYIWCLKEFPWRPVLQASASRLWH